LEKNARRMRHEVCDGHLARQYERHRAPGKANQKQSATHELDDAREPKQRKQLELIEHRNMWKMQELGQSLLQEQQRDHNAKHTTRSQEAHS
jgi:flagellar basal body rod protein FlgG